MHRIIFMTSLLCQYSDHCNTFWKTVLVIIFFKFLWKWTWVYMLNIRSCCTIQTTVGTWWWLSVKLYSTVSSIMWAPEIQQKLYTVNTTALPSYINGDRTYCCRAHWSTQCNKMSCLTTNPSPFSGLKLSHAYGQTHDKAMGAFVELLIVHIPEN